MELSLPDASTRDSRLRTMPFFDAINKLEESDYLRLAHEASLGRLPPEHIKRAQLRSRRSLDDIKETTGVSTANGAGSESTQRSDNAPPDLSTVPSGQDLLHQAHEALEKIDESEGQSLRDFQGTWRRFLFARKDLMEHKEAGEINAALMAKLEDFDRTYASFTVHGPGGSTLFENIILESEALEKRYQEAVRQQTVKRQELLENTKAMVKEVYLDNVSIDDCANDCDRLRLQQLAGNECSICRDAFERPCAFTCGHVFCLDCAVASVIDNGKCPSCRGDGGVVPKDLTLLSWEHGKEKVLAVCRDAEGKGRKGVLGFDDLDESLEWRQSEEGGERMSLCLENITSWSCSHGRLSVRIEDRAFEFVFCGPAAALDQEHFGRMMEINVEGTQVK